MSQAIAIANYLLDRDADARRQGRRLPPMTPMKSLKLVYYAHGWFLGIHNAPLVTDERVEAWKLGPVYPSLYHAAKKFGNGPIKGPLVETDWDIPQGPPPTLEDEFRTLNPGRVAAWLDNIFADMGGETAFALSDATHLRGSPWDVVYNGAFDGSPPRNQDIPQSFISKYFSEWVKNGSPPTLPTPTREALTG